MLIAQLTDPHILAAGRNYRGRVDTAAGHMHRAIETRFAGTIASVSYTHLTLPTKA